MSDVFTIKEVEDNVNRYDKFLQKLEWSNNVIIVSGFVNKDNPKKEK